MFNDNSSIPLEDLTVVREQIGAQRRTIIRQTGQLWNSYTDVGTTDYTFWDKARRGQAKGLELSGLLLKPLGSKIAAWVVGRPPLWQTQNKKTADSLNDWWQRWQASIERAYNESLDLGDCYLVFNGDASITVVSPNMVEPITDPEDVSRWIGWKIKTTVPSPTIEGNVSEVVIEDHYTATKRTRIVSAYGAHPIRKVDYPNPLGVIPVVHINNQFGSDERFGRPVGEPLLPALIRYGDIFDAALKGNIRQGRPTPVIEEMGTSAQIGDFWDKYGRTETFHLPDGTTREDTVIDFDPDQLLTLGGTAKFKYAAPENFTTDTSNLLNLLFDLIAQNSEIPEFIWGMAIGSSKASAQSQLEPFVKFIDKKRGEAMSWINQLAQIVVAYFSVYDRSARGQVPMAMWRPMTSGDGRLTLDSVIWAWTKGLLDDEFAVWLLPINIDNPKLVLERAKAAGGNSADDTPIQPGTFVPEPLGATPAQVTKGQPTQTGAAPASGTGADQGKFPSENPIQPTERQMSADNQALFAEFMSFLKERQHSLYEQSVEVILDANREDVNAVNT